MALVEALRAIVAEVELGEISVGVPIGETTCEAEVPSRKRELQSAFVRRLALPCGEDKQAAHIVPVSENPVIGKSCLHVDGAADRLGSLGISQIVCAALGINGRQGVFIRGLVVDAYGVVERHICPVKVIVGLSGDVAKQTSVQPLGDEGEVLLQFQLCQNDRVLVFLVASRHLSVRIQVVGVSAVVSEKDILRCLVLLVGGEEGRESYRACLDRLRVHGRSSVNRTLVAVEGTAYPDSQFRGLCEVDVHIGPYGVLVEFDVVVEEVLRHLFEYTVVP